jgi:amino acid transporter
MEALSEMIHYWPISNGIVEFVATFVDKDLGTILGFAYWQVAPRHPQAMWK